MKTASFNKNVEFKDKKLKTELMLETDFSKEIRISMKQGQEMKEHQSPYPIIVQVLKGKIEFGAENKMVNLSQFDLVSLEGYVPHNLIALEESLIRLSVSKFGKQ